MTSRFCRFENLIVERSRKRLVPDRPLRYPRNDPASRPVSEDLPHGIKWRLCPPAGRNFRASIHLVPASPSEDPIETAIAEAVASGVLAIVAAVDGYLQTGALDPALKDASATWMAKLSMLQLDHTGGDEAFVCTARNAGRRALRKYFDDDFFRRHGQADTDAAIDLYINDLLGIVGNVVHVRAHL